MNNEEIINRCIGVVIESSNEDFDYPLQLVSKAHALALETGYSVAVISLNECTKQQEERLANSGADYIYECDARVNNPIILTDILENVLTSFNDMKLLVFMSTTLSQEIAARLSIRRQSGLTAECFEIKHENDTFILTRAAMNSSITADIICINSAYSMCTIKRNVFLVNQCGENRRARIIHQQIGNIQQQDSIVILEKLEGKDRMKNNLNNAKIVFGCGRGVIESGCLDLAKEVASKYNAELACSRVLVEESYMDYSYQVGQSGISIAPDVYFAIGLSGACQHMVGIKNASTIIAVNNDKNAPIFEYCDYAIIADLKETLLGLMRNA